MRSRRRVLFLGADSCNPDLAAQWAAEGRLPFFAHLRQSGLRARTRGPAGIYGGALWPTFVTGTSPGRHRMYTFNQYSAETYADERFFPDSIVEEPFWLRLDRAGRRVGVFDVPLTPLTSPANGFHVSEWGWHDLAGPRARCSSRAIASEVARVVGEAPMRDCEGHRHTADQFGQLRDVLVRQAQMRTQLASHFLAQGDWDFFACVFGESHCAGHQMWHLHDPSHPRHNPELVRSLGGDPLLDVYRVIDHGMATLASHAGEDTIIVVWCSHGMGPHYDATFLLDAVLQKLENPTRSEFPPAWLRRARKLWSWIPSDVRRPLSSAARAALPSAAVDRQSRRYFTIPDNNEQGAIRINLIGRDAHGVVQPGAEYDAVLSYLREALLELENAETGTPIVTGFQYPQALHPGPYAHELPDMTVEWDRSAAISKVRSPRIGLIERTPDLSRSGDRTADGMLFVLHPGIRGGELDRSVDVLDLAPTIARLLEVSHDGLDGRPIREIERLTESSPRMGDSRITVTASASAAAATDG